MMCTKFRKAWSREVSEESLVKGKRLIVCSYIGRCDGEDDRDG